LDASVGCFQLFFFSPIFLLISTCRSYAFFFSFFSDSFPSFSFIPHHSFPIFPCRHFYFSTFSPIHSNMSPFPFLLITFSLSISLSDTCERMNQKKGNSKRWRKVRKETIGSCLPLILTFLSHYLMHVIGERSKNNKKCEKIGKEEIHPRFVFQ
jgi:hypothetical protein